MPEGTIGGGGAIGEGGEGGPAILVHGGAGRHPSTTHATVLDAVRRAADAGWQVLAAGGTALAAVEAATRVLEDEPLLDAGIGSYLNADGDVEVDAIVMDGATLDFGAVAAVQCVAHPVTLARHVLSDSPHALLVGEGAERFARRLGLTVPAATLVTDATLRRWRRDAERAAADERATSDTVGAVALDAAGHVAAATSTGGMRGKWPGRVGDSPIVGAGAWADDAGGAVSATGDGEAVMRVCLSHAVGMRLADGMAATAAALAGMQVLVDRTGAHGGLIVLTPAGDLGWASNTREMPVAWRTSDARGRTLNRCADPPDPP